MRRPIGPAPQGPSDRRWWVAAPAAEPPAASGSPGPEEARTRLKQQLPVSALSLPAAEGPLPLDAAGSELTERLRCLDPRSPTA